METSNLKCLALIFVLLLVGISSVMALSVGGSIGIDIKVNGSSANITTNTTTNTTTNLSNQTTTQTNNNETDTQTNTNTNTITNTVTTHSASNRNYENDYTNNSPDETIESDNSDITTSSDENINESFTPTGASVSKNSINISKTGKILIMFSTIVLALVFIGTLLIYKRKMNYNEEIIGNSKVKSKKRKRK
jgi:preprotein translocase subunit SecF